MADDLLGAAFDLGFDDCLLNEDDDDDGPAQLLHAAAVAVVDAAEAGAALSYRNALAHALPLADLESSMLLQEHEPLLDEFGDDDRPPDVQVNGTLETPEPAQPAEPELESKSFVVMYEGKWWHFGALVRALDGYVKSEDRGRKSRFWNAGADRLQAVCARRAARAARAARLAAHAASGDADDAAAEEDDDAADEELGEIKRLHYVAAWVLGKTAADPGELGYFRVHRIFGKHAKKGAGYVMKDSADPDGASVSFLTVERFERVERDGAVLQPLSDDSAPRFFRLDASHTVGARRARPARPRRRSPRAPAPSMP